MKLSSSMLSAPLGSLIPVDVKLELHSIALFGTAFAPTSITLDTRTAVAVKVGLALLF